MAIQTPPGASRCAEPVKKSGSEAKARELIDVVAAAQRLDARMQPAQVRQLQFGRHLLDEGRLLGDGVEATHVDVVAAGWR